MYFLFSSVGARLLIERVVEGGGAQRRVESERERAKGEKGGRRCFLRIGQPDSFGKIHSTLTYPLALRIHSGGIRER